MTLIRTDIKAFITYVWRSNSLLILFSMVFIAVVQLLLIYFNSTLEILPIVEMFLNQLPPQFNSMFGDEIISQVSVEGTIAFGLEHPLVITLITFIGISIISSNIATDVENKQIEIILSHPFKRETLITSLYVITLVIIGLTIFAAFVGAVSSCYFFFDLNSDLFWKIVIADINAYFLHIFIMSYTLFFSVLFKEISKAVRISAFIALTFYFINIISDFWSVLEFTKYFNFFSYFNPQQILVGHEFVWKDMLVLSLSSAILFVISYRIFKKKDIF